mmetsp:Transcript_27244/g.38537  ORF Transcript_27244/g.38537 Transcript_27244/m.38537 type:complete len:411 (-) Transcript_27244:222-1454(-)|eukprot:CAMPEP_0202448800 /NCGR_PEP_ID=MMETSP1360-20130828/7592_1 /ASSEMBLY_ACC=CAM_ASM_000848 /TAXON_ID=515479 /ORGANISM="Licmophora paradoxa, Strain CCMP2313" /LENGTH=410 /DNA_ID=CAMNT_0049066525 /DNA_START=144 /DNA_END=1376 /DNA_ORIENTATION=+
MFSLASGIYESYFAYPQLNVLLIGAEGVGKTTLLERLKVTEFTRKSPDAKALASVGITTNRNSSIKTNTNTNNTNDKTATPGSNKHKHTNIKAPRGIPSKLMSTRLANSESFKAAQETIERDIHRTYPRHAMFHDENEHLMQEEKHGNGAAFNEQQQKQHVPLNNLTDEDVHCLIEELDFCSNRDIQNNKKKSKQKNIATAEGGQAALRRVLRAYSVYDREVGYCQGMNFIAGMFLTFMTEEEAFWLLVAVMTEEPCRMRGLFGEAMSETHRVLYVAEKLIHQFLPQLAKHLDQQCIHITMYATQWLMTQYTSAFQFDLVLRVWDCFLADGWKVIYRVMLALLQESQDALLELTFEGILGFFRELPQNVDGDRIIEVAFKIPLRRAHLDKYAREYTEQLKQKEQAQARRE